MERVLVRSFRESYPSKISRTGALHAFRGNNYVRFAYWHSGHKRVGFVSVGTQFGLSIAHLGIQLLIDITK